MRAGVCTEHKISDNLHSFCHLLFLKMHLAWKVEQTHPSSARVQGLPAYLYNYVIYRVTILVTKRLRLYLCYQLIITKL